MKAQWTKSEDARILIPALNNSTVSTLDTWILWTDFFICKIGWKEKTGTGGDFYLCSQSTPFWEVIQGASHGVRGGARERSSGQSLIHHLRSSTLLFTISGTKAYQGFLGGKESACSAEDLSSILGSGRSPGEGNGNPLQYSCLENPTNRGGWQAVVHGVAKSQKRLSNFTRYIRSSVWSQPSQPPPKESYWFRC